MTDIIARLIELAARRFGKEAAGLRPGDDIIEVLGIDSNQALELASELELAFAIEIPDYELQEARTFEQLAKLIARRR